MQVHDIPVQTSSAAQNSAAPITTEVVRDLSRLRQLKAEWDGLWARSVSGGIYLSFDGCLHMWEAVAEPGGRKLFCLVGRRGKDVVATWPLTTFRQAAWRCVRPLEASGAEYTDLLLDPGVDAHAWLTDAVKIIKRQAGCDVMILPYVKANSVLHDVLRENAPKALIDPEQGVEALLRNELDWESYYTSLSSTVRKKNRAFRRKLEKIGPLRVEIVPAGDPRCPELVGTMLDQKKAWTEQSQKSGPWITSPEYRNVLTRFLSDGGAVPRSYLFTLWAGDILMAIKMLSAGKKLCEALVASYNPEYGKFAPGMILDEYCVQWAFENRLNCDFGNGLERNKLFWSRHATVPTATFTAPLSFWGHAYLHARNWSRKRRGAARQAPAQTPEENDE